MYAYQERVKYSCSCVLLVWFALVFDRNALDIACLERVPGACHDSRYCIENALKRVLPNFKRSLSWLLCSTFHGVF